MKKVILSIVAVLVIVAGIFSVVVAMQPEDFKVERSLVMNAPVSEVFPLYNDFHNWNEWSPWAEEDRNAKNSFDEGAESGKGAIFKWDGNAKVGQGSMTIVDSQPNESVKIDLQFIKPFEGRCDTLFSFAPESADKTKVTWTMSGKSGFFGRAFCTLMGGMDRVNGPYFEKGLKNVKRIVEDKSKQAAGAKTEEAREYKDGTK